MSYAKEIQPINGKCPHCNAEKVISKSMSYEGFIYSTIMCDNCKKPVYILGIK